MSILASSLLAAAIALQPDAGLRLYNPHDTLVQATLACAGSPRELNIAARDAVDVAACANASLESPLDLVAFETATDENGVETQRVIDTNAACPSFAVAAPLFGCKLGTVTVAAPYTEGATYTWSVEGASVVSGHGTNRLVLTLGEGPSARVSATVTGACTAGAEAIIAVRNPIVIEKLEVPALVQAKSVATIRWTYAAGTAPASQMLTGDAFDGPVVLAADVRSYTWEPRVSGVRDVELRASHAPAIPLAPQTARRRRAVGPTREVASECPSARATGKLEVRGCNTIEVAIDAPQSVEAGSTFTATVFLRTGETVKWTVSDGTIVSGQTEAAVVVMPDSAGTDVTLEASITAGPGCQATAQRRVSVNERAACATSAPSAALSVERVSCDFATVRATFTGTPPFRGTWSDGTHFETSEMMLLHDFRAPASYTIRNLSDALCRGGSATNVRVTHFGPTVSVSTKGGTCPGATGVATFTGTPPFTGRWAWGEWFTTNEMSLELPNVQTGVVAVEYLSDAQCPRAQASSNVINIGERATAKLRDQNMCSSNAGWYKLLQVDMFGGTPPFTVYWSDGAVTKGNEGAWTVSREVPVLADQDFTVERVASKSCDAILASDMTVHVNFRRTPEIERTPDTMVNCSGKPVTARLKPGLDPDAKIQWSISRGEILSGQGTSEITYVQNGAPPAVLTVQATYPDEMCPATDRIETYLAQEGRIEEFTVTPSTIKAGGTAEVLLRISRDIDYYSLYVAPESRQSSIDLMKRVCSSDGRSCTFTYKDSHGPGNVMIGFGGGGPCTEFFSKFIQLTITQ